MTKKKEMRIIKYLKAPIKMLIKARDLYIRSMTQCSERVGPGGFFGIPTAGHVDTLNRSFSTNSARSSRGEEDFRELIRAASTRCSMTNGEITSYRCHDNFCLGESKQFSRLKTRRNHSVDFGRIDEDKACDFGDDPVIKRGRSYSIGDIHVSN